MEVITRSSAETRSPTDIEQFIADILSTISLYDLNLNLFSDISRHAEHHSTSIVSKDPIIDGKLPRSIPFFFYDSLTNIDTLKSRIKGVDDPVLQDAWTGGSTMELHQGIYPALVPAYTDKMHEKRIYGPKIYGKVWYANSVVECVVLQPYETGGYRVGHCQIHVRGTGVDGEDLLQGLTFAWNEHENSEELRSGAFRLERWIEEAGILVEH